MARNQSAATAAALQLQLNQRVNATFGKELYLLIHYSPKTNSLLPGQAAQLLASPNPNLTLHAPLSCLSFICCARFFSITHEHPGDSH